jgi:hypothetical protein
MNRKPRVSLTDAEGNAVVNISRDSAYIATFVFKKRGQK